MKKILVLVLTSLILYSGLFAKPTLNGNKIYLDDAKTSLFTTEQFIANVGGEEVLDISDEAGHTKRMQLELFTNPNKVIEFENEEVAERYYNAILSFGDKKLYSSITHCNENPEFILFLELSNNCTTEGCTPTYCYFVEKR